MVVGHIDIAILVSKPIYRYIPPGIWNIFRYKGEKTAHNRRENKQGKKFLSVTHSQYSRQTSIELCGIEKTMFDETVVPIFGNNNVIE
jgi:hypothetical protein